MRSRFQDHEQPIKDAKRVPPHGVMHRRLAAYSFTTAQRMAIDRGNALRILPPLKGKLA
jgi:hypothetical protein